MKIAAYRVWERSVREITVPDDGMTLDAFSAATRIDPTRAEHAARYLHRRKVIWLSIQRGHARVYPEKYIPSRGRPPAKRHAVSLMSTKVVELIASLVPGVTTVVMLVDRMPKGGWQDQPEFQAEIRRSIGVEAKNVLDEVRKFVLLAGYPIAMVRSYLWLTFPTAMAAMVETQPELERGSTPLSVARVAPKRIKSNLEPEERIYTYVEAAGVFGIGAYEIANRTRGAMKLQEVVEIAYRLEDGGMLYTAEARTANVGTKGIRLYSTKYEKPHIGSDGRRIPPLAPIV